MGRVNKSTEGVFVNIVGNREVVPSYNQFMNQDVPVEETGTDRELVLAGLLSEYDHKVSVHKMDFHHLATLEVLIMQLRIRMNFKDTVKLYFIHKKSGIVYIYARCPFYRNDSDTNEVRILIDNAEFHTTQYDDAALSKLSGNQTFMEDVYYRLSQVMDDEIAENLNRYKKIYQN